MPLTTATLIRNAEVLEKKSKDVVNDIEDHYFGGRITFRTKIAWRIVLLHIVMHSFAMYGISLMFQDLLSFNLIPIFYNQFLVLLASQGTTAGAHRLWSHRSYRARRPLRIILMLMQTLAGQFSCYKWAKDHRQHHKYSDTDGDPHNPSRGLFFSHIGWLMVRKHPECVAKEKTMYSKDLESDPVLMFQKRHYLKIYFVFGFLLPVGIPMLFGQPYWKSLFVNFFARYMMSLHTIWSVNSLAHLWGNKPYDRSIKPTENPLVAFISHGEGWHNYHHAFPMDYKASEFGKHFNFTRDLIEFFEKIGWAYNLKVASNDLVSKTIAKKGDGSFKTELAETNHSTQTAETDHSAQNEDHLTRGW